MRSAPGNGSSLVLRALGVALAVWLGPGSAAAEGPSQLLIRLRATGPHAISECAESLGRRGLELATAAADDSDSLDRIHRELGVREMRAVFRRPDGSPLARQRERLRTRAAGVRSRLPARVRKALPEVPDLASVYSVRLRDGADPEVAAARYAADPHVVWAQPNHAAVADAEPDDPFFFSSGSWGQSGRDLWGLLRVGAPAAWDTTRGEGVVLAVIDTGIDTAHPDLVDNLWVHPGEDLDGNGRVDASDRNGIDDDGNGFVDDFHGWDFANSIDANEDGDYDDLEDVADNDPFDDNGHGTHVAGTALAVADNGIGIAGVAPRARLMALKGFPQSGSTTFEVLVRAIVYAADNGARVMNNSWSCGVRCPRNPIAEEAIDYATSLGVVVVTSAGNRSDDVQFYSPENRRNTLAVAASVEDDTPAAFSNRGFLVDVTAPGSGEPRGQGYFPSRAILSLRSSGAVPAADGGGAFTIAEDYLRWSGTSMAAPHVAGVVALVVSARPDLTPDEVRGVIRSSARDLTRPGHDRVSGAGLVDAAAAVGTSVPSVRAEITEPDSASVIDARVGEVVVRGSLEGDFATADLSVGFGLDPVQWLPIPFTQLPVAPETTFHAVWDTDDFQDGPYVLRLEVNGADGVRLEEFRLLSLERNPPTRISSPGAAARSPALARGLVAWQSNRPLEGEEPTGLDLFVSDLATGAEWRAVTAPGHQREPVWSAGSLVWLDGRDEHSEVYRCQLERHARLCRELPVAQGPAMRTAPVASHRAIVWTERREDARDQLRGCSPWGGGCRALELPDAPGIELHPTLDGSRLAWSDWSGGTPQVVTCALSRRGPACLPTAVQSLIGSSGATLGAGVIAWWFRSLDSVLLACPLDPETGSCPPQFLGKVGPDTRIATSGQRIVWDAPGPGTDRDIFFCEFDLHTNRCPVQRITGSSAEQRNPAIRGDRVVWEDDRDGVSGIFGLELPSLTPLDDRVARSGRPLFIGVQGRDPSGGELALAATFADGTPLADRGAQFFDLGNGRGLLVWTPDSADLGEHAVSVAGVGSGGLFTRNTFRIEVVSGPPWGPRRSRFGDAFP